VQNIISEWRKAFEPEQILSPTLSEMRKKGCGVFEWQNVPAFFSSHSAFERYILHWLETLAAATQSVSCLQSDALLKTNSHDIPIFVSSRDVPLSTDIAIVNSVHSSSIFIASLLAPSTRQEDPRVRTNEIRKQDHANNRHLYPDGDS